MSAPEGEPSTKPAPQGEQARIEFEKPYKLHERPRKKGRIQAAGEDEALARWNVGGNGDPDFVSSRKSFHPGARVIVDTRLTRGKLPKRAPKNRRTGKRSRVFSEHRLLAHARKWGYWNFRLCFENALRKKQTDGGKTTIQMNIAPSGKVSRAKLVKTTLEDSDAARCLVEYTLKYRPFEPAPRQSIALELDIRLSPGDAPVPLTRPTGSVPENPGQLDSAAVEKAAESAQRRVRKCYAEGLGRDPALWGRVQLEIKLDAKGRLRRVRETESQFPDPEVSRCVRKAFRRLAYPRPEGGALSFICGVRLGGPAESSD